MVYTIIPGVSIYGGCGAIARGRKLTFREEASGATEEMPAKEPTIIEVVVSFYQLDSIAFKETQFICAACLEVMDNDEE